MLKGKYCKGCKKTHQAAPLPTYHSFFQYCQGYAPLNQLNQTTGQVTQCLVCEKKHS